MCKKCHPKIGAPTQTIQVKFMVSPPPIMLSRAVEYVKRENRVPYVYCPPAGPLTHLLQHSPLDSAGELRTCAASQVSTALF